MENLIGVLIAKQFVMDNSDFQHCDWHGVPLLFLAMIYVSWQTVTSVGPGFPYLKP